MSSRASVASSRAAGPQRFIQEPQETSFSQAAYTDLERLKSTGPTATLHSLQACLDKAAKLLSEVASEIEERAAEDRTRRQNQRQKHQRDKEEDPEEEIREHQDFQKSCEEAAAKLDHGVRKVVDNQAWIKEVPKSVQYIITTSKDIQARQNEHSDSNEDETEDQQMRKPNSSENGTALLQAAQSTAETRWNAKTLTERYAQSDAYKSFYELRWTAANPGEAAPPMPHSSIWFAKEEGRNVRSGKTQRATQRATQMPGGFHEEGLEPEDEEIDDTDIQIDRVARNTKCPLSLTYFEDPVSSKKCPHSYEKSAFENFFKTSSTMVALSAGLEAELERLPRAGNHRAVARARMERGQPRWVQCPDAGCSVKLFPEDVRPDPALHRLAQRAKEREKRQAEDVVEDDEEDSEEDGMPRSTQRRRVFNVGSSPASRRKTDIKPERGVSVVSDSE